MLTGLIFLLSGLLTAPSVDQLPRVAMDSHETPPAPRSLVLCLDGTWNSTYAEKKRTESGETVLKPTNVLKLCRAVLPWAPRGRRQQLVYYDVGVGSMSRYPGTSNRLLRTADKTLGGGWGAGFEANVEEALTFLVHNYEKGDHVFVFGFSRGAATARAVTRFLDWSGGLPVKSDAYYLPVIFRAYVAARGEGSWSDALTEIDAEREAAGKTPLGLAPFRDVDIALLGVWDTVMALGSRFQARGKTTTGASRSYYLGARPARCVRHARQALAVDEVRYDFRPAIWRDHREGQTLEQRWFAGVHSNVGGGYVDDGLANVAFHWIVGEAVARGLEVDARFIGHYRGFPQDRLYRSESWVYRMLDGLRLRFGRGRRALTGHPESAHLTLDRTVIHRINAEPERFDELQGKTYRPANVLQFLACRPDLDAYLRDIGLTDPEHRELPPDVRQTLQELRANCDPTG